MKYIVLINKKINENQIIILNLILQNFNNINNKNKSIQIFVKKKEFNKNILIDNKSVNFIKYEVSHIFNYLKILFRTKEKKRIINFGEKNIFFRLIFLFIKKSKFLNINTNKLGADILEKDQVCNLIKTIFHENIKNIITKPKIILDEKVANNALQIINWNLTSSGYKKLEYLKYIFIYINSSKIEIYKDVLNDYVNQTNKFLNLKIIFILNKVEISSLEKILSLSNRKNIITNYFKNNDKHYLFNFSKNAKITVTDDLFLHLNNQTHNFKSIRLSNNKKNYI